MMASVRCPKCNKTLDEVCTDACYELDDREPEPGEEEEAANENLYFLRGFENKMFFCCGEAFMVSMGDPHFRIYHGPLPEPFRKYLMGF